ncbi:MAG: hypothetical protein K9I68_06800 [Bacteroidales bacterium]|nr:hypothetical protein [Bacteroidales bacterium]MCF8336745.1 hypothetical protein [Bacteroidales bacterium]
MKKLVLHINESVYEDLKRFLRHFSNEKVRIEEETPNKKEKQPEFSYDDFEEKWAGLLTDQENTNWKEKRIDYLNEKHT